MNISKLREPAALAQPPWINAHWRHAIWLGAVLLLAACGAKPDSQSAKPIPVKTAQLGTPAATAGGRYPVSLARDREANLAFRVGGVVESLNVRAGQTVQAGQTLARLQQTAYVAARTRAEAEVSRLQNAAQRNQELLQAGAISNATRDDTEDALKAARAALSAAHYDEQSSLLQAPFSGVILSRDAELGETVGPGQRILRLADLASPLLAKAAVPQALARQLRVGQRAQVFADGLSAPLDATIRFIGAQSDARTANVSIDLLLNHPGALASGTVGTVEFSAPPAAPNRAEPELRLPPEALLESRDGTGYVYLLDAEKSVARRTAVKILGFDGEWLRISGLAAGSKVITTGAGFVADGQSVQEVRP